VSYRFASDGANPHLGGNIAEGDPLTFAPKAWNYLIDRFAAKSVLDLGSGNGYAADYFHHKGARVLAVDGLEENVRDSRYPTILIDLTKQSVICEVDLVHCQEVVEHIEEAYLGNLLASLACGRFLVMSHAFPGQAGYHHVNLQSTGYWIEKLASVGMRILPEDTKRVKALAEADGAYHLSRSGLVFAR
jgi:2-polyprenyl-3-methyl-5-hydroxy-6-metoxy-1,4-benzoquinol methylase